MSITLYELNDAWFSLQRELESTNDPELREALLLGIDNLEQSIDEKMEAYCIVIKNLQATQEAIDVEIERLRNKSRALVDSVEAVIWKLKCNLPEGEKWVKGVHSIGWRKSESVKVIDDILIPTAYMRETITYEADKQKIKTALKAGEIIPGTTLEIKNNIQIK
jgi:hypothetical protein